MIRFRPFAATTICGLLPLGAQIVPTGTGVALPGKTMTIPSDLGSTAGGNLFHSFSSFNLSKGQSAVFTADPKLGILNVISRVTGDTPSKIDGTIRSEIPGANLFLMNPNGISFGPNASLDVRGAFVATTADYLRLGGDGQRFYANDLGGSSSLVSHPPDAFGFLGSRPKPITVEGSKLESFGGRTVELIGGDITIRDAAALSGNVVVAGAGGAGEVRVADSVPRYDEGMERGGVRLVNSRISAAAGSGFMGRLLLSGGSISLEGSSITSTNFALPAAPPISLDFTGSMTLKRMSSIESSSEDGAGSGADVSVKAGSLLAGSGGGFLSARAFTTGGGGEISVEVRDRIELGGGSFIESYAPSSATAAAGDLNIKAGSIRIDGELGKNSGIRSQTDANSAKGAGGSISIRANGAIEILRNGLIDAITGSGSTAPGGAISLSAAGLLINDLEFEFPKDRSPLFTGVGTNTAGAGDAGKVSLDVGSLVIRKSGRVDSSSQTAEKGITATGKGGEISILAGEILIDGTGAFDFREGRQLRTGVTSFTSEGGVPSLGAAGNISVIAGGDITLLNGGLIDSSTFGTKNAGEVDVRARNITIDRRKTGIFTGIGSDTNLKAGGGEAGSVKVTATNLISLVDGGQISATTFGDGKAGTVTVEAGEISISGTGSQNASVVTRNSGIVALSGEKSSGAGGDISVTAFGELSVYEGGIIGAEARGSGSAGSVDIDAGNVLLSGGNLSVIAANASAGTLSVDSANGIDAVYSEIAASAGTDGGKITVTSEGVIDLRDSEVRADAKGTGGDIVFSKARHLVLNRTPVSASAVNKDGGSITVETGTFFASGSPLSVTSEKGAPGTVEIRTLDTLAGGQEMREEELLDPDDILQPDCALRNPDVGGSFTKGGRGGTRRLPGGYLPSFRIIE